ncbi:hypothetical protein [Salinivibrio sp. PR6]|uniref:hypothetical protein n=1 Tax=Salinivibrio sp. PR6 TaxID=1909485 RepID=UPI0010566DFC|nr:hypothetical protein [Salinivibrio sp. PR6]
MRQGSWHSARAFSANALTAIYRQREPGCQQAHEQANRTCPSGYDPALRYLHQLHDYSAFF